jgi:phenylacetate-CoA ligase
MYPAIYRTLRSFWPGGLETRRYLKELKQTQWLSEKELQALQLAKIQHLVKHAYDNVPFYRQKYQEAGLQPEDIKTLKDFELLPFVTRQDIDQNLDQFIANNVSRQKLIPNETGGSTGHPMRFFITSSFWWWNAANWFRVREWHGVSEGEKMAWLWGAHQDMPEWSFKRRVRSAIMQERYLNAFNMTEDKMLAFATMLEDWQPVMLKGYASVLSLFARFLQEKRSITLKPRLIESTSEKLSQAQRQLLQEVFPAAAIVDHYSSREMGTIAYQCASGEFLVCADVRHLEIVAGDQVVPAGEMGEVVVTSLNQFAMPFIRYKNGDVGIYEPVASRSGHSFPVLKEIIGRTNDFLVTGDGKFVHSEFFAYTFRIKPQVVRFQVYQADKTHLEIRLVCKQAVTTQWLEAVKAEVQNRFGPLTHISLEVVDDIPLTPAGKHRYIVSEVKPDFIRQ